MRSLARLLISPTLPGGALSRFMDIGDTCERLGGNFFDFFAVARAFAACVDWRADDSCGDIDVVGLIEVVASKHPAELSEAVRECIEDGALHLRPVLSLPHSEMGAAFFLELLEAAAKEGVPG